MAPSPGHLHKLLMRNVKLAKSIWRKTSQLFESRLPSSIRSVQHELEPVKLRSVARQPLHRLAQIRQTQSRWFSTARGYASGSGARRFVYDKTSFPKSRTGDAIGRLTGRTPFASTLRPNLTGGTLGRTAGGYSLGSGRVGGARYFSHSPTASAQVVQNVSQAVRTFWLAGKKAQFDGVDPKTGFNRYRTVTNLQHETSQKLAALPKATPGSYIDFKVNPTITALAPLASVAGFDTKTSEFYPQDTLNSDGLLDILSVDFARALKDLAAVLSDLKQLASLGDLPITYRDDSLLRVHFPGCDAESVERLCEELGVRRGIVCQDDDFDAFNGTDIALLFPYAPSQTVSELEDYMYPHGKDPPIGWDSPLIRDDFSTRSEPEMELFERWDLGNDNVLATDESPEDYGSLRSPTKSPSSHREVKEPSSPLEYQDFEGILRFIELCNAPQSRPRL